MPNPPREMTLRNGGAPLLSVVTPAYNAADFIEVTIRTVAGLRWSSFELLVVDDGSNDDTYSVANSLIEELGLRGRVIRQSQGGVSAARNRGLASASGHYVLFLDSDDWVDPVLTDRLAEALRAPAVTQPDVVCWRFQHVEQDGKPLPTFDRSFADNLPRSSSGLETLTRVLESETQAVWTGSAAYRRNFLEQHGLRFTEGCATGEDSEFIWKALALAERVTWIDEVLSSYVRRAGSATGTASVNRFDGARAYQRAARFLAEQSDPHLQALSGAIDRRVIPRYMVALVILVAEGVKPRALLADLRLRHPGLTSDMRRSVRDRLLRRERVPFAWIVFLLSPLTCVRYLRWKHGR